MASSSSNQWPPGFRFRPTDQELVAFYLSRKVQGRPIHAGVITEVDLYKCEPWDLPDKSSFENDVEWYFFSPRDKKYPNGSRTNRATEAGYWKATGKDRAVRGGGKPIGMKKTLVFYKGRAPHGQRTDWIMHEYRLDETGKLAQDPFVLCRVFRKTTAIKNEEEAVLPCYGDECFPAELSTAELSTDVPAPSEPDEGQVCSPQSTGPLPTHDTTEELNAFLMFMLDEHEQQQPQATLQENGAVEPYDNNSGNLFDGFHDLGEAELLECLNHNVNPGAPCDESLVNDLLQGDYFEMNDLPPQQSPPDSPSMYLLDDGYGGNSKATPWKTEPAALTSSKPAGAYYHQQFQQPEDKLSDEKKRKQNRLFGMLGSVQVLPASASELKVSALSSAASIHMNVRVTTVTITCDYPEVAAMNKVVKPLAAMNKLVKPLVALNKVMKRQQLSTTQRNVLFFFILGSLTALFWMMLMPRFSRLFTALCL